MIKSCKDKRTERFARGELVQVFESFAVAAERKLALLNDVKSLDALGRLHGKRLKALRKDRLGQHSIRINDQWRICFVWNSIEASAEQVEITDYH